MNTTQNCLPDREDQIAGLTQAKTCPFSNPERFSTHLVTKNGFGGFRMSRIGMVDADVGCRKREGCGEISRYREIRELILDKR
jgi:hypothetical protein